ncbi:MAG: MFS family permease, partial [Dinoroseobacter sp.]
MSLISLLRMSQAPIAGFAAIGTGWGTFAAAIPDLKASLQISESELGLALFFGALGAVISMAASAKIMEWLGTGRKLIAVICLLLGAAFVGPSYATSLAAISLAMACVGLTTGLLDVVINARVSQLEARTGKHLMSLGHGMFSLAYAIAAICTGFAREAGFAPSDIYPVAAGVITLYAIMAITGPEVVFARETPSGMPMPKAP